MKIDWRRKLGSRKFWALAAALAISLLVAFHVDAATAERVAGVISAAGTCMCYMLAEAHTDAKGISGEPGTSESLESEE